MTPTTLKLVNEEPESLESLVTQLQQKKIELAEQEALLAPLRSDVSVLQARLTNAMAENRSKRFEIDSMSDPGKKFRVTYTSRTTTRYDEQGIEKALGKRAFNKLTVRKFDSRLFQEALSSEELSISSMEPFISTTKTASVRTYEVNPEDFDEEEPDARG